MAKYRHKDDTEGRFQVDAARVADVLGARHPPWLTQAITRGKRGAITMDRSSVRFPDAKTKQLRTASRADWLLHFSGDLVRLSSAEFQQHFVEVK